MRKTCLYCQDLLRGRSDKKFCGDSCRSAHYQRHHGKTLPSVRRINKILRTNYRILVTLNKKDKTKVHIGSLRNAGYNFQYHTHLLKTKKGHHYTFCYDLGILEVSRDWFILVRSQEQGHH